MTSKTRLHYWIVSKLDDAGVMVPMYGIACFTLGYVLAAIVT